MAKVFLGDRGFLRRYGSRLPIGEIERLMRIALSLGLDGLAVSDPVTSAAACRIRLTSSVSIFLHTRSLIDHPQENFVRHRVAATLQEAIIRRGIPLTDNIVGEYLRALCASGEPPVTAIEAQAVKLSEEVMNESLSLAELVEPDYVSLGGDWLDFCALTGRLDLVKSALELLRSAAPRAKFLGFTYLGPIFGPEVSKSLFYRFDGLAIPANTLGDGMVPSSAAALAWAKGTQSFLCAFHPLAMGKISPKVALPELFYGMGIDLAVVGASGELNVRELGTAVQAMHANAG